jgi:hypothetical protein
MPTTLTSIVRHIYNKVPNSANSKLIVDFHQYMLFTEQQPKGRYRLCNIIGISHFFLTGGLKKNEENPIIVTFLNRIKCN